MPSAVIEVVIGLAFVFFLFAMMCSGVNELISRVLGKRADFLAAGVWRLLDNSPGGVPADKADEAARRYYEKFWEHPLIRQLGQAVPVVGSQKKTLRLLRGWWPGLCSLLRTLFTCKPLRDALGSARDPREFDTVPAGVTAGSGALARNLRPSYVPSSTFATVALTFLREINDLPDLHEATSAGNVATTTTGEASMPKPPAPQANTSPLAISLQAMVAEAGDDATAIAHSLACWYDNQMERVSGWYKRESKRVLIALAAVIVVLLNVDTVSIARTLWTSPTQRSALADAIQQQVLTATTPTTTTTTSPTGGGTTPGSGQPPSPNFQSIPCPDLAEPAAAVTVPPAATTTTVPSNPTTILTGAFKCAKSLGIPIGWRVPRQCPKPDPGKPLPDPKRKCSLLERADIGGALGRAGVIGSLLKIIGWAFTVGAITLGAPFWFDLLNRFGSMRTSGAKPKRADEE